MNEVSFDPTFEGWRLAARRLLADGVSPDELVWRPTDASGAQQHAGLDVPLPRRSARADARVPRRFMALAASVVCHRSHDRWAALYRVLWRLTGDERHLLDVASDLDVHRLLQMDRAVRRAAHKMKAFVRFRAVPNAGGAERYVAWFEPAHLVVERTAPFFSRRFGSMRWSILTPDRCAHWDTEALTFSAGVCRSAAASKDDLEALWRTYYAGTFNPARLNLEQMRSEMPALYWRNLPEAPLIRELAWQAPSRVARMLADVERAPEALPDGCRALAPVGATPLRVEPGSRLPSRERGLDPKAQVALDAPGWHPSHDPGLLAARRRSEQVARRAPLGLEVPRGGRVLVGVAGWTDPTLTRTGTFYPAGTDTPEARLRHYASQFPVVEVDSTYYSMPTRANAVAWAARTPDHFVFDVKAHGLMTGHGADLRRLPDWLRRALPRSKPAGANHHAAGRVYARDLAEEVQDEIWRRFLEALEPLREAGKLGAVLLQFPRWFTPSRESARALERARERLGEVRGTVEFRHREWLGERVARRSLGLLRSLDLSYVVVDGPQGLESSVPPRAAVTATALAVLRLHGRRCETWEARNDPPTERYRYLYEREELAPWAERVMELAKRAGMVHVIFNNCHGNYGATNAFEFTPLLLEAGRATA